MCEPSCLCRLPEDTTVADKWRYLDCKVNLPKQSNNAGVPVRSVTPDCDISQSPLAVEELNFFSKKWGPFKSNIVIIFVKVTAYPPGVTRHVGRARVIVEGTVALTSALEWSFLNLFFWQIIIYVNCALIIGSHRGLLKIYNTWCCYAEAIINN